MIFAAMVINNYDVIVKETKPLPSGIASAERTSRWCVRADYVPLRTGRCSTFLHGEMNFSSLIITSYCFKEDFLCGISQNNANRPKILKELFICKAMVEKKQPLNKR